MNGTKTGWIFPIIIAITFVVVILLGISQCKTEIEEEEFYKMHNSQPDISLIF